MSDNKVSNIGIVSIGKALQTNTKLQMLDISNNKISDSGVFTFSDHLKGKSSLYQLIISWDDIHLNLTSAEELLSVRWNQIGNSGVFLILAFLYHSINMQELDIS